MTTGTEARGGRIAIVAGGGALPKAVVRTLAAHGEDPFVVLIAGEGEDETAFIATDHVVLSVEQFGSMLPMLKKQGVGRVVLAGSVSRRPRLSAIPWNIPTLALLRRLAVALTRGDDGLLRALIRTIEAEGFSVVGAHEIVPDLLAPQGRLTRAVPTAADRKDIDAASQAAAAIGMLDIGQGAIAIGGRVIALEGIEGTDGLLARTAAMRDHGRLAGKRRGVLVKRCKPQQEQRADLPAIGPDTIENAHAAGLVGVAVEAGRSFILDFEQTIARADALGLFVVGLSPEGEAS